MRTIRHSSVLSTTTISMAIPTQSLPSPTSKTNQTRYLSIQTDPRAALVINRVASGLISIGCPAMTASGSGKAPIEASIRSSHIIFQCKILMVRKESSKPSMTTVSTYKPKPRLVPTLMRGIPKQI
jgi:hypothetical protein